MLDKIGGNVGTFRSSGTFTLDATQKTFSGPGTFAQFDSQGKLVVKESFEAKATKVEV